MRFHISITHYAIMDFIIDFQELSFYQHAKFSSINFFWKLLLQGMLLNENNLDITSAANLSDFERFFPTTLMHFHYRILKYPEREFLQLISMAMYS